MTKTVLSEEHKRNIGKGRMGKLHSGETKAKMKESQRLAWVRRKARNQKTIQEGV